MSLNYTHYAMFGIDISDYRDKIIEKEEELDKYDGIENWCHNYNNVVIGYNFMTDNCGNDTDRTFFGIVLDEAEEHGNYFSKAWSLWKLESYGEKIINKWKEFVKTYFPNDEIENEFDLEIKFMSVWN